MQPKSFVFCEKSSGTMRFRVDPGPDGDLPVERAAGLLAMHCYARGKVPADFEVLVAVNEALPDALQLAAEHLLSVGRAINTKVKISPRERQVLEGLLQYQANKEIAARLNLSERTVKFHVSSLLSKFGVRDRGQLIREAALDSLAQNPSAPPTLFGFPVRDAARRTASVEAVAAPSHRAVETAPAQVVRMPRRRRFA